MSCTPKEFAGNAATGDVNIHSSLPSTRPAQHSAAPWFAYSWLDVSPQGNGPRVPARAAYSHSASLGSLYWCPVRSLNQRPCYTDLVQALHSCPACPTASPYVMRHLAVELPRAPPLRALFVTGTRLCGWDLESVQVAELVLARTQSAPERR